MGDKITITRKENKESNEQRRNRDMEIMTEGGWTHNNWHKRQKLAAEGKTQKIIHKNRKEEEGSLFEKREEKKERIVIILK